MNPANFQLFKDNNRITRKRCAICSVLREKYANTEIFLVRIFPFLDFSVFSPNKGNYGPEKTQF